MRRPLAAALVLAALSAPHAVPAATKGACPACCRVDRLHAIEGQPGYYRIDGGRPGQVVRSAALTTPTHANAIVVIHAKSFTYDADNNAGTLRDTVRITPGTTVRWQLDIGIHTVTNGLDALDPTAGSKLNVLLTSSAPTFDSTFTAATTMNFFCQIHGGNMAGTVIVAAAAGVPQTPAVTRAGFSRPPAPNPARGPVSFAIALPRATPVVLTVHDVAGREIATLAHGTLEGGEHLFRWDGRDSSGRLAASGRYLLRLQAGDVRDSRAITLVR